ncbi:SANT/Myb domain-containing protein [Artemisia annua]|uniref:SANT/Myb domain-containing protein n=1 Tax=Artemisia annua TaxID=35608 RepID=A0A2U1KGS4_ARTAN|nr:SANT/Myb domain-containing protein [Artemisia annua]
MDEKYGMIDLISHYMNGNPIFPTIPQPQPQPQPQPPHELHYSMVMLGGGGMSFGSDSTMGIGSAPSGLSCDSGGGGGNDVDKVENGGCSGGRWPKEETLALLEIRSRLDYKFRETNHKGPLWDEVSRIMCVEHGYKRTGKKCSEKCENLYKYYKKIKEGKAGRQDKKHYRFFRQLEAIYGETSTSTSRDLISQPLVSDNPSSFNFRNCNATLPQFMEDSDCAEKTINKKILSKKRWKTSITDFIETKMNTLMEKQDAWMKKVMNTIDEKENERISKEQQWRKEEAARLEIATKFRSNERAWMESRDSAIMAALHKLTENEASSHEFYNDQNQIVSGWGDDEITQLIQLRSSMETRFEQGGCMEDVLWEEIALTMGCLGYNRNAFVCKAKWDHINFLLRTKKRKENTLSSNLYYDRHHSYIYH